MMKTVKDRVFSEFEILKKVRSVNGQPNWTSFFGITVLRLPRRQTTLFVRSIKSKFNLLKLVKRNVDVKIRQCDRTTKVKMNRHPDNEKYIKPLIIKEGDKVLVKQDEPRKKNNKPYSTTP